MKFLRGVWNYFDPVFDRNVDYLDGYGGGPYRWLVTFHLWKLHFILGQRIH